MTLDQIVKEITENADYKENIKEIVSTYLKTNILARKEWENWFAEDFKLGEKVRIDSDNEEWGRVASNATVIEIYDDSVLVNAETIKADILVLKREIKVMGFYEKLSKDNEAELNDVLNTDELDEAMYDLQTLIGQTDGGICGIYFSK